MTIMRYDFEPPKLWIDCLISGFCSFNQNLVRALDFDPRNSKSECLVWNDWCRVWYRCWLIQMLMLIQSNPMCGKGVKLSSSCVRYSHLVSADRQYIGLGANYIWPQPAPPTLDPGPRASRAHPSFKTWFTALCWAESHLIARVDSWQKRLVFHLSS